MKPEKNLLISVADAKSRILSKIHHTQPIQMKTASGLGCVLAEDIISPINFPPFSNSSMDGYAVRSIDLVNITSNKPIRLKVIEDIPAGYNPQKTIEKSQASRIMTGAVLPQGADAVVPVEFTNYSERFEEQSLPDWITIYKKVLAGDYVRQKGQDIQKGDKILLKDHFLRPQDLGAISGVGIPTISIYKKPKIGLISSGDEIVAPGQPLKPGQIYDINSLAISSLLTSFGAEVIDFGVAKDNLKSVEEKLNIAVDQKVDLIVSTAGVSMGVYDHIRNAISNNGDLDFWRVNIRPGKPLVFGNYQSIPFFGVPGNPVSAFIIATIFLKPVIKKLSGIKHTEEIFQKAILLEEIESDGRESYLRAKITENSGKFEAKLTGHQGSGNIFSLVSANALLVIPAGVKSLPKGREVNFISLNEQIC